VPDHERHGRRRFYIVGEGVLADDPKKRLTGARADATSGAPPDATFRFSRIVPGGSDNQLDEATRKALADAMTGDGGAESNIPSGFTYLGQFIDHDLTMDTTKKALGDPEPPFKMLQGRSPALDLDSLYGRGPSQNPEFYQADHIHLRAGFTSGTVGGRGFDLPRVSENHPSVGIPDPRNDENLAVAQTHLAFIRFHNRVVDALAPETPHGVLFSRSRNQVVRHYQWMIRTDFLPRICDPAVVDDVFANGRKIFEKDAPPTQVPTMAIEFSVAAYRLGHSMVRQAYNWNKNFDNGGGTLDLLFTFSGTSGGLTKSNRLPDIWIADFRRLYHFGDAGRPGLEVPAAKFNNAMTIDTNLVDELAHLRDETIPEPHTPQIVHNLAFRNLTRAEMVRLPTGQEVADFLNANGVSVTKLTAAQITNGSGGVSLGSLTQAQRDAVVQHTPLWFYVLREAELNGGRLGGVGARIVAEVFHRAMEGSATSILHGPPFTPSTALGSPDGHTFRMVDLMLFAFEGNPDLLNPNH
jgi:Animal haem peroxidase